MLGRGAYTMDTVMLDYGNNSLQNHLDECMSVPRFGLAAELLSDPSVRESLLQFANSLSSWRNSTQTVSKYQHQGMIEEGDYVTALMDWSSHILAAHRNGSAYFKHGTKISAGTQDEITPSLICIDALVALNTPEAMRFRNILQNVTTIPCLIEPDSPFKVTGRYDDGERQLFVFVFRTASTQENTTQAGATVDKVITGADLSLNHLPPASS